MPAPRAARDPTGGIATEAKAGLADVVLTQWTARPPFRSKAQETGRRGAAAARCWREQQDEERAMTTAAVARPAPTFAELAAEPEAERH